MPEYVPKLPSSDTSAEAYDPRYYLDASGQPQGTFAFNGKLTLSRAQAIADTAGVPPGGSILDYGCGLGALTLAFNMLGYDAVGIDPSPHAIEHALPEAKELVRPLDRQTLRDLGERPPFDLVVAKDVFEHIHEDQLHDEADRLLRIGRQILAIIPLVGQDRKFMFPLYENDPTHITRLTREEWLGFFPYSIVQDCHELTPKIRRSDKVASTLCLRLAEPDPKQRQYIEWAKDTCTVTTWQHRIRRALNVLAG